MVDEETATVSSGDIHKLMERIERLELENSVQRSFIESRADAPPGGSRAQQSTSTSTNAQTEALRHFRVTRVSERPDYTSEEEFAAKYHHFNEPPSPPALSSVSNPQNRPLKPKRAKKFYNVYKGTKVGIFTDWCV